jgi:putative ABC transport system permease protein
MALAIVLLAGAGVLIRSFLKIHSANMGVNTANVLVGTQWGELPSTRYARADARVAFYDQIRSRVRSTPGVESAALAWSLPTWGGRHYPFEWSGAAPVAENRRPIILTLAVSPSYFQTLGAAVLAGRDFSDADRLTAPPVAIVNQQFANTYWRGQGALSKRLRLFDDKGPGAWLTVVGIASNIIQGDTNRQRFDPVVYLPFSQMPIGPLWVFARTRVSPASLAAAFRSEIQAVDPDVPVFGPFTLAERLEMFWDNRFYGAVFLVFAAIALLLASIGLYTLTAKSVSQRTQEIGVRMAIGATARDILQLVFEQSMLPLGIGLGIGLAVSLAVNRLLQAELVEVSPSDPITLSIASAALVLSGILGCLIPARRAMRVDPAVALRHE